ncbi:hypothetical protein SARC_10258 [Sphaeroforma arctica JP610]|uniref:Uncharacterized protein n=1 Tax=Sphaeroforma arctica JP610 TaxID=667725 RepID=A0A0L0FKJ0_9EUKA|nr:hypothetical protein SARC_10258 [Sphaeroforma arctica JP610]KNC77280.1 hypothetical protein SARC_10258 [Sphaeroforma arctica JP610]|eukprot:XP_014151182.1 hypothetical protein SARC_10258 [Sphaeroforma arctica JP610]
MSLCQYPALVRSLLDSTDATEKSKSVLNNLRDSETHAARHFTDPEQFNRIIIDRLRSHPVDYLLEKFLNDMQNKKMNVEVRTERVHKTMAMLEERYRNIDKESIHCQILKVQRYLALKYHGLQSVMDTLIKGDKQPDESEGHLSDMDHAKFHFMTEAHISEQQTSVTTHRLPHQQRLILPMLTNGTKQTMVQTTTIPQGDRGT